MSDDIIAALRRERVGYAARGLADRVAAVDAQLRALGADAPVETAAVAPAAETAARRPGRPRRAV